MDENEPKIEKTKEETDRKCPDCGGVMDFDPATGGLTCPYCGHQEEIQVGKKIQPAGTNAKDSDEEKEKIFAHCRKHLAKYAMPYDIEFRDDMPKTLVGKVAYRVLEEEELMKIQSEEMKKS